MSIKHIDDEGKCVVIRQAGAFIYIGRVVHRDAMRIVITDACWIANTGNRWGEFLATGIDSSMEDWVSPRYVTGITPCQG
jgi:hypothetical protein